MASSAISSKMSVIIELVLLKRRYSMGSLRLNPKVKVGLLAQTAVQQMASLAMGQNSFQITLLTMTLQRYSSISLSSPAWSWSYLPRVTVYTIRELHYLYMTFATMMSRRDWAMRQFVSYTGYTFLLIMKPRTKACIFLRRAKPSFFTVYFRLNGLGADSFRDWLRGGGLQQGWCRGGANYLTEDSVTEWLAIEDQPARASRDRLLGFFRSIYNIEEFFQIQTQCTFKSEFIFKSSHYSN